MRKNKKKVLKIIIEPFFKEESSMIYQMEDEFLGGFMHENPTIIPDYFGIKSKNKYQKMLN